MKLHQEIVSLGDSMIADNSLIAGNSSMSECARTANDYMT